jgi:hypothetical protein
MNRDPGKVHAIPHRPNCPIARIEWRAKRLDATRQAESVNQNHANSLLNEGFFAIQFDFEHRFAQHEHEHE